MGGVDATPGDLPWQAAMRGGNSGKPFCGATLISKKWAVSAAHCQIRPGQQIVLGAHNFRLGSEGRDSIYKYFMCASEMRDRQLFNGELQGHEFNNRPTPKENVIFNTQHPS